MQHTAPDDSPGTELGRRYLTLLFADLSQSTELAEAMETEHYAAVLSSLRKLYQATIPRHGGVVVRVQGDGLLAMFGYPVTREDDGRVAVMAALALHQQVRELRAQLPAGHTLCLHTGIHSGLVLLQSGALEVGRFELLGAVPNTAARLSDAAGAHEILVSDETLGPARRFFVTGPPRLLKVKGRPVPLLVYRVDARASAADSMSSTVRGAAQVFVGREQELGQLEQALAVAMAGATRSVAVAGAPGMGKTRLIEHFLLRVQKLGLQVHRGYCESDLGGQPMQPFHHMLPSLGHDQPPHTPAGFADLFAALAEQRAVLLFIDDWQWADDASHQVLAELRERAGRKLLIVLSTRSDAADRAAWATDEIIDIAPLNEAQAQRLVFARLPQANPFVVEQICRQASGNPLFVEELCHNAAQGDARDAPGRLRGGAGWLKQLVESRVQRLPRPQIELVRMAAVIGNVVPEWLLRRISDQHMNGAELQGLAQQDFLFPGERAGTLRFKHGLTRDIVYDAIDLPLKQALHLRIAEAIHASSTTEAQDDLLELLAMHYEAGGEDLQAAQHATLAGDKALAASALDRARAYYRMALAALDRLPQDAGIAMQWSGIVQRLARVCVFDPVRSDLALYVRALELAHHRGDAIAIAQVALWLGYISYALGDGPVAVRHCEFALARARAVGDDKLVVQAMAALGEALCAVAEYDRALSLLDEVIAIKRRHRSERHRNVGLAFSLVARAQALGDRGLFAEAAACLDEAASCVAGVTHEVGASIQGWKSAVLLWQGAWAEAREAAAQSGHIAESTRSLTQLSPARAICAFADFMLTREPRFLQTLVEATVWLETRESSLFRRLRPLREVHRRGPGPLSYRHDALGPLRFDFVPTTADHGSGLRLHSFLPVRADL